MKNKNTTYTKAKVISPNVEVVLEPVEPVEPEVTVEDTVIAEPHVVGQVEVVTDAELEIKPHVKPEEMKVEEVSTEVEVPVEEAVTEITVPELPTPPVVEVKQQPKQEKANNMTVSLLNERIKMFTEYRANAKVLKASDNIKHIVSILELVLLYPDDTKLLNRFFSWFKAERGNLLKPNLALLGIQYYSKYTADQLMTAYTLFYLATGEKYALVDFDKVIPILQEQQNIILFLKDKINLMKPKD